MVWIIPFQKACEKLIGSIGSLFDLPDDVIERSKELFGIIYKAVCFQSVAVETKKITAGRIQSFDDFFPSLTIEMP